jgi:hypothetical protein
VLHLSISDLNGGVQVGEISETRVLKASSSGNRQCFRTSGGSLGVCASDWHAEFDEDASGVWSGVFLEVGREPIREGCLLPTKRKRRPALSSSHERLTCTTLPAGIVAMCFQDFRLRACCVAQ